MAVTTMRAVDGPAVIQPENLDTWAVATMTAPAAPGKEAQAMRYIAIGKATENDDERS